MFDTHTHLQDPRFDSCRAGVLEATWRSGITTLCCCGTHPGDWTRVTALAGSAGLPRVVPAFGVHPWYVDSLPKDWTATLRAMLLRHPDAAVGEIGLDGLRRGISRERQRETLMRQLDLAVELKRVVLLHGARAWGPLMEVWQPYAGLPRGACLHAYGGSAELLSVFLRAGVFVSFAGSVCNPRATRLRKAARAAPLGQLLVETDSPDLMPFGGVAVSCGTGDAHLNQPANLRLVIRELATLKNLPIHSMARITTANALRFFGK